ncbi:MAG: hypothetical protein U0229_23975 [Anaeromyxobacter sp.]
MLPALALAAVLAAPSEAGPAASPWSLALGAGTDFPVSVAVRGELEGPWRLRLTSSIGILPGAYVDAINWTVVKLGGYDADTARLVKSSLQRSLIWRTHAGARLWRGLYAEAGYGLVTLGGAGTGGDLLAAVTGRTLPVGVGERTWTIDATLQMLDVEVGWQQELPWWGLRLRASLGGAFTLASHTRISPSYQPLSQAAADAFARDGEAYLDDVFTTYVHTPVLGVSLSYPLF